jgi:hypothetical protein
MAASSVMFEPYNAALWEPKTPNYVYGTPQELEQKLKLAGINLRRELVRTAHEDIGVWTALISPPSVHQAMRTLMLNGIDCTDTSLKRTRTSSCL